MFDTTIRYFAFSPALLANADAMRDAYGAMANTAPDHNGVEIQTMLCGLDNVQTGKLRALHLGVTAIPIGLIDERQCLSGYWALAAVDAFNSGDIDAEELTLEEVKALTPISPL